MRKMILDEVHRFRQHVRQGSQTQAVAQQATQQAQQNVPIPDDHSGAWKQEDPRPQEAIYDGSRNPNDLEASLQRGMDVVR